MATKGLSCFVVTELIFIKHAQSLGAVVDTLVRTKILQLYSGQGTFVAPLSNLYCTQQTSRQDRL